MAETTPTASELVLAERAPDRGDGLADDDAARVAERQRRDGVILRIDLDQRRVVEEVPADDLRRDPVAVVEGDVDPVGAAHRRTQFPEPDVRDDVRVGEDVTLVGDDEAGALRALAVAK